MCVNRNYVLTEYVLNENDCSKFLLFFFFCEDGSDRLMKRAYCPCCIFLCVVLAATLSIAGITYRVVAIRLALSFHRDTP